MESHREATDEESIEFWTTRDDLQHFVFMAQRPGCMTLMTAVEWFWYSPLNKKLNDQFHVAMLKWEEMVWVVFSVPKERTNAIKELAEKLLLRISDGVPTLITLKGVRFFPGSIVNKKSNQSMSSIENASSSPIYDMDAAQLKVLHDRENEILKSFVRREHLTSDVIRQRLYPGR